MGTASINGLTYPTTVVGGREWLSVDYLGPGRMSHPDEYPNGTFYPILSLMTNVDLFCTAAATATGVPYTSQADDIRTAKNMNAELLA